MNISFKSIAKNILASVPYKKKLYLLLKKVFGVPPLTVYQHLYFQNVFEVEISKTKAFKIQHYGYLIENDIFWRGLYGGWEKESLKLWSKFCHNSQTIVDVGANTGVYSLLAKTINPDAKVYAFEPISRVYQKLLHNIQLNNFDIVAIDKAVSNNNGTAIIYDTPSEHQYGATLNLRTHTALANTVQTEIETITLASFADLYNLATIDLIKIDAERHEAEVLQGFLPMNASCHTTFLIEIIDLEVAAQIQKLFNGTPYLFFSINEKQGCRQVEKLTRGDGFNFLICTELDFSIMQHKPTYAGNAGANIWVFLSCHLF